MSTGRSLTTAQTAAVTATVLYPALLFDLCFDDNTYHVWAGIGNLVVGTTTYLGVGSMGKVTTISEGTGVEAKGITLSLSGIDPSWLPESLNEINLAATATVYLGILTPQMQLVGNPINIFSGIMDGPQFNLDTKAITISIDVESELVDMNRSRGGRLTDQDQKARYPNDNSLQWVNFNQDLDVVWKS